jgi:hypothetical protein
VLSHDLDAHTLRLQVSRVGHKKNSLPEDPPTVVELHYSAFKRVQRYSKYAHEATYQYVGGRPSNYEGLGAQRKPYRTLENLELF